jgi:DNA topoisomerase I
VDEPPTAPVESARAIGLRYVSDDAPGFRRVRTSRGFHYKKENGKNLRDADHLARIKSLAIPPAWTDVWICPYADGHLQATGRDARGRKQHRYHPRWRAVRDETKFNRIIAFAKTLPRIRKRLAKDLRLPGLPRNKVLAAVVKLLEKSFIRVGNEEYERQNNSYGLTTMKDRHVEVNGSRIEFQFRGKSGRRHTFGVDHRRVAQIVRHCQELPGQELFQYVDDNGVQRDVKSEDVNAYLREITGQDFTAKDFRTWAGTVLAAIALEEFQKFDSMAQAKRNITQAIENVARQLGNTPAICRKCYIHPAIVESYMEGTMIEGLRQRASEQYARVLHRLKPEEAAVIALVQRRLNMQRNGKLLKSQLKKSLKVARERKRKRS